MLLHERLVPYVRTAAATAAARCGLPVVRPHGPSLWVAPVLEAGAREREADLPRGDWIEAWSERLVAGGGEVVAPAPLERIPVWVRRGALVVTYPAEHVAAGLGDTPERERPL